MTNVPSSIWRVVHCVRNSVDEVESRHLDQAHCVAQGHHAEKHDCEGGSDHQMTADVINKRTLTFAAGDGSPSQF